MRDERQTVRHRRLLTGWIALPVLWLAQLQATYALAGTLCQAGARWQLLAITAVAALATLAIGARETRAWRRGTAAPPSGDAPLDRLTFAGQLGAMLSVIVLLALAAQAVAILAAPCG